MLDRALNLVRILSFQKIWNIYIVQLSYILSNLMKKPIVWGKPWFVSIEPASVCNLSCPQCPVGAGEIDRTKKFMELDQYRKLIEEISGTTSIISLYFQGEPLMNNEFTEFVRIASKHRIYTQTSTNAQLLTEEVCRGLLEAGLDRIIISLDGTDQESYQAYRRGGEFQKVEDGVRTLVHLRGQAGSKNPLIIIQFLVFRHNQDQIPEVKKLAKEWGADNVWIKSAQVEYPESADEWIPAFNNGGSDAQPGKSRKILSDPYSRYEKSPSGEWRLRGKLKNRCKRLWQTTVITSDALVVPCCFDKHATYQMGNSGEESLAGIWKSKVYNDFRKQILTKRKSVAICMNCTEGIVNTVPRE
ncbi:radical SAM/SPASM domain-containing protein [Bacteroidota bacterium]